ncbi:MAG: PhoU domain-containing protein, partial [Actinomycetota bacterium]
MVRVNFHEELEAAEAALLAQGSVVREQIERVLDALDARDENAAHEVIVSDDEVDEIYL